MQTLKKLIFISITFLFCQQSFGAWGFAKPQMSVDITAFSLKEVAMMSKGTATNLEAKLGYLVDDSLSLNLWPVASFSSGQQASRDQLNPLTNLVYLKEASVQKKWSDVFFVKMGALYQKEFLEGMSGQAKAFPALSLNLNVENLDNVFIILVQVAAPTSSGLATSSSELENNTSLYSGTFKIKTRWSSDFLTEISYAHFVFNRLSSAQAAEAYLRGNSINKIGTTSFAFLYKYEGDELNGAVEWKTPWAIKVKAQGGLLKNTMAPEGLNSGLYVTGSAEYAYRNKEAVAFRASHFRIESDATVAVFSDPTIGRANRMGRKYAIITKDENVEWQIFYGSSTLLEKNALQSDDEIFGLSFSLPTLVL